MKSAASFADRIELPGSWLIAWLFTFAAVAAIWLGGDLWSWAVKAPKELTWKIEALGTCTSVRYCVTGFFKFMVNNEAYIFPWTFKEFTRAVAACIEFPYEIIRSLFASGFTIPLQEGQSWQSPPVSWLGLMVVLTAVAYRLRDWKLALMVFLCIGYLAVFGHWESAAITFSSIAVAGTNRNRFRGCNRHFGISIRKVRTRHYPDIGPYADRSDFCLSGTGAFPVRIRARIGHCSNRDLCHAANGAGDHSRFKNRSGRN